MRRLSAILLILVLGFFSYSLISKKEKKEPYDVIIKYVNILDGTGEKQIFKGNIGIRNGYIESVGYINDNESPSFDASGLTAIPFPLPFSKNKKMLEHLYQYSYPRYPAERIYLMTSPYAGRSLLEVSQEKGFTALETYKYLWDELADQKVILIPKEYVVKKKDIVNLLAGLTGKRAEYLGIKDSGVIKESYKADIYLYNTKDYSEEKLMELLLSGKLPEPLYKIRDGRFIP